MHVIVQLTNIINAHNALRCLTELIMNIQRIVHTNRSAIEFLKSHVTNRIMLWRHDVFHPAETWPTPVADNKKLKTAHHWWQRKNTGHHMETDDYKWRSSTENRNERDMEYTEEKTYAVGERETTEFRNKSWDDHRWMDEEKGKDRGRTGRNQRDLRSWIWTEKNWTGSGRKEVVEYLRCAMFWMEKRTD